MESESLDNSASGSNMNHRSKRYCKKKTKLIYLLKFLCASQESCIDWLKNKGLIPKVMFCPNCCRKMQFEYRENVIDNYIWICRECEIDPPMFSTRHGSWLDGKFLSLVDIMLFTYLWSHGFSEVQIRKETNMSSQTYHEWNNMYNDICESLHRRRRRNGTDEDTDVLKIKNKESPDVLWRLKNKYRDPFLQFLKDADSL